MTKRGFLLALVMLLSCGTGLAAPAKSVHFVTDKEKEGGFLLAITKAAFERVGYQVEVEFQPWGRALGGVMTGEAEALLGAQYTDERAAKMQYSEQVGQSEMVFFKLKETQVAYNQLTDLKNYTIGTISGSAYTPEFDSASYFKKDPAPDYVTNIRKLLAKRMPLFVEKKSVVLESLKTQFPGDADKIDFLSPPLKVMKFYNCFSKAKTGYEQKVADFNAGLAAIMKDGTYKTIMNKGMHE
ncbi:substrate-binding periplasmic protein [Uliginosibacterium gangwonense]|uniref:substrate-binding periplasmic protein n=1 Tax=Uliginosibacterium gangwonense TaxID=392736 RepID=UPI0003699884|nr:transporter substrate-binding domain-containing protein [Uliginosibacterium gangwonense]